MKYFTDDNSVTWAVPADGSQDYLIMPDWVESSKPVSEESQVPVKVERFQARVALHNAGLLDQVESIMGDAGTDMVAREAWVGASAFRRDSVTIQSMGLALGLSDEQIDGLFVEAGKIQG